VLPLDARQDHHGVGQAALPIDHDRLVRKLLAADLLIDGDANGRSALRGGGDGPRDGALCQP
jgi:hypothetical protein